MAAAVRLDAKAFSDPRFDMLAKLLGLPDGDCARGKMSRVWSYCTDEERYDISAKMLNAMLGDKAAWAVIESDLGEVIGGRKIRIKGLKGRIEWLSKLRKNSMAGGEANRLRLLRGGRNAGIA